MLTIELHLKLSGMALILLGIAHGFFGSRFSWKQELQRLSLLNRQIFYVHTFFIALVVTMLGILSCFFTNELLHPTPLARVILVGIIIFWSCRLIAQFLVYDSSLWKASRFNTCVHIFLSLLWLYLVGVNCWALWHQMQTFGQ